MRSTQQSYPRGNPVDYPPRGGLSPIHVDYLRLHVDYLSGLSQGGLSMGLSHPNIYTRIGGYTVIQVNV